MLGYFYDFFMTFKSFSDVLTFLSDEYRIGSIINTCVYLKKNIEFCGMRCTVREMWSNGDIVTCGYISEKTRVIIFSFLCQILS